MTFYIVMTYVVAHGVSASGLQLPRSSMLGAVLFSQLPILPTLFIAGMLSDRYGRRRLFMTGVVLTALWEFVLFPLIETRSIVWISTAIAVGLTCVAVSYGPLAAMFTELFSTSVRYSAVSLSYQIGAVVGSGVGPIVAAALYAKYQSNIGVSALLAGTCVLSLVCVSMLKEARGRELGSPFL